MEPRPEGRGEGQYRSDLTGIAGASMEPRPEGRGERIFRRLGHTNTSLQWSHVPKDVERRLSSFRTIPENMASMEPRPEGRGESHISRSGCRH